MPHFSQATKYMLSEISFIPNPPQKNIPLPSS